MNDKEPSRITINDDDGHTFVSISFLFFFDVISHYCSMSSSCMVTHFSQTMVKYKCQSMPDENDENEVILLLISRGESNDCFGQRDVGCNQSHQVELSHRESKKRDEST